MDISVAVVIVLAVVCFVLFMALISVNSKAGKLEREKNETLSYATESIKKAQADANLAMEHYRSEANIAIEQIRSEVDRAMEQCRKDAQISVEQAVASALNAQNRARDDALIFAEVMTDYVRYRDEGEGASLPELLAELEADYGFSNSGKVLGQTRKRSKEILVSGVAASCDNENARFRTRAAEFILETFNVRAEVIFNALTHENCSTLLNELRQLYTVMNANTKALFGARIAKEYYEAKVKELKAAGVVKSLQKISRDEQRALAEQRRDEEKAKREIERALREAAHQKEADAKEEAELQARLELAQGEERQRYEGMLADLRTKIKEHEEKELRAKALAEFTKRGSVYIVSNIGSFGEDVLKIGMTRRLFPKERVDELSGASVPFPFDIHAMIETDDAPQLEFEMHQKFGNARMNKINLRKEFYRIGIGEVRSFLEEKGLLEKSHFTLKALAKEYRDSLIIDEMPEQQRNKQIARFEKIDAELKDNPGIEED
jgi:hypothetical protein